MKNYYFKTFLILFILSFSLVSCASDEIMENQEVNEQNEDVADNEEPNEIEEQNDDVENDNEPTSEKIIVYTGLSNYIFDVLPYTMFAVNENGIELWSKRCDSNIVAIEDDIIYAGIDKIENNEIEGRYITALDAFTGEIIWEVDVDTAFVGAITIDEESVYFVGSNSKVFSYSKSSGALNWDYEIEFGTGWGKSSPVVLDGLLYCNVKSRREENSGSANDRILALDTNTGALIWEHINTSNTSSLSSVMVSNENVYTFSEEFLVALNSTSGAEEWRVNVGLDLNYNTLQGGRIYAQNDTDLFCFDAVNGAELWNKSLGSGNDIIPLVYNGIVYTGWDFNIVALEGDTGNIIWQESSIFYTNEVSPNFYDGYLYTGNSGLRSLNANNGEEIWSSKAFNSTYDFRTFFSLITPAVLYDTVTGETAYPSESGMRQ